MKRTAWPGVLAVAFAVYHPGTSEAAYVVPVQADTFVTNAASSGAAPRLQASFNSNADKRQIYLRFDLGAPGVPSTIGTAELRFGLALFVNDTPLDATFRVWGLNDLDPGEGWAEAITSLNAPAHLAASNNPDPARVTNLGTFFVSRSTAVNSTVTFSSDALAQFLNADTDNRATLIITRVEQSLAGQSDFGPQFWSKEGAAQSPTLRQAPALVLSEPAVTAVPAPSAAALALVGLTCAGLARLRSRPPVAPA
jgi:hypothetical protein